MSENVWIINHYATKSINEKNGRHYWFNHYLNQEGYTSTIISASTWHGKNKNFIKNKLKYEIKSTPFTHVYIKSNDYKKNNIYRILNILNFYRNLMKNYKNISKKIGKPDIIYASSAHLLSLVAGIKIAKYFKIPCVCEVRDLWPESFVSYGLLKESNPITKILYKIENKIYKDSDQLIFTMPGAKGYLEEKNMLQSLGGSINDEKVNLLNNGVDLDNFNFLSTNYNYENEILENDKYFKLVYTGSMRPANQHLSELVKVAELLKKNNYDEMKILLFGDGPEKVRLQNYCKKNNLYNIYFEGHVDYKYIPSILKKSDVNILNCKPKEILKYGGSQNKLFQYIASGNPIITAEDSKYSLVKNVDGGIAKSFKNADDLYKSILRLKNFSSEQVEKVNENLMKTSEEYDYQALTKKLTKIFEKSVR